MVKILVPIFPFVSLDLPLTARQKREVNVWVDIEDGAEGLRQVFSLVSDKGQRSVSNSPTRGGNSESWTH